MAEHDGITDEARKREEDYFRKRDRELIAVAAEIGVDFIASGEYRTLLAAYREIQDIKFPVVATTSEAPREEDPDEAEPVSGDGDVIRGGVPGQRRARPLGTHPRVG